MKYFMQAAIIASVVAGTANAEPKEWTLDIGHTHVGWEIDHMNLSPTVGQFRKFDGTFLIDEEEPQNSQITFTVQSVSVDSNHVGRDNHLVRAEYLNAAKFPEITFTSTEVQLLTPTSGKLHGDVEMLGVTAPLILDFTMVQDTVYPEFIPDYDQVRVISFEAEGEVFRLDHGMDFIAFLGSPTGLSVNLDLNFDLVDCTDAPDTNIPCNWGRVDGFVGPNE